MVAALAAGLLLVAAGPPGAARAVDQSKGHPGFCENATGVTVVIDFQQLGGTTIVRCNPRATRGTGLDALKGAGFQIGGVLRWGEAFICRIENRPSAVETIPVKGNETYKEKCIDTPPAAAYWSYWHAGNNCPWVYSQWGVKNRDFIPGGFEGWSFSLNATADTNPKPRIAAVRPGTGTTEGCDAKKEPKPTTNDPNARQPGTGGQQPQRGDEQPAGDPTPGASAPGSGDAALPPPKPRSAATGTPTAVPTPDDPAKNVAFTGGEAAADVNDVLKKQAGASDYAPWVAVAAVLLLGLGTWLTARRRRRARET